MVEVFFHLTAKWPKWSAKFSTWEFSRLRTTWYSSVINTDVYSVVIATVCTPATSAPEVKRATMSDDVIGDRKPRDLRQLGDYDTVYDARKPMRLRPLDEKRFVGHRWKQYYQPDLFDDDKRSIRPL